jgi:hypothetical protein
VLRELVTIQLAIRKLKMKGLEQLPGQAALEQVAQQPPRVPKL